MELYHGTNFEFQQFKSITFDSCVHEYYGNAIYFSACYDVAKYYGNRVIKVEIPEGEITTTFDAKGNSMYQVSDNIKELVNNGGIIKIIDVCDSCLAGRQFNQFDFDETETGNFKYLNCYLLKSILPRKKADHFDFKMLYNNVTGHNAEIWKNKFSGESYLIDEDVSQEIVDDFGEILKINGIVISKELCLTPLLQTTIIFAGEKSIKKLNSLL